MHTLAQKAYFDSDYGTLTELPSSGTALENPYAYDSAAREVEQMASKGLVKIVDVTRNPNREGLIKRLIFQKLR